MALVTGFATLGTIPTVLFREPAGPGVVTITSDTASTCTVFIGAQGNAATSATVSTTSGMPLVSGGALSWAVYAGTGGYVVSGVGASSPATIGWIVSSAR